MSEKKRIDLSFELTELRQAIEGARILIDASRHEQLGNRHQRKSAPAAAASILALVVARLRSIDAVLTSREDPAQLWTPQNDAVSRRPAQWTSWSPVETLAHARTEWRRAVARVRFEREKRAAPRPGTRRSR